MNDQNNNLTHADKIQRRNRFKLLGIAALFLLPFVGALYLYMNTDAQSLWATTNHGRLIAPVQPLHPFELELVDDSRVDLDRLMGKWTLVYFSPRRCDESCKKTIYHMRQIRAALGKNMHRVQRILLLADPDPEIQIFLQAYPQLWVARDNNHALDAFKKQFPLDDAQAVERVYLVDPLGNLMMMFSTDLDPRDILKDLKKLLKTSKIG